MFKKIIVSIFALVSFGIIHTNSQGQVEAASQDYHTKAITVAKSNIGVPYRWGGMTPNGFDCSGLVKYSYQKAGKTLNRTAAQMYAGNGVRVSSMKPGDLMFFAPNKASKINHVAMYIGSGKMIMSSSSKGVMITTTTNSYWKPKYVGAKRI